MAISKKAQPVKVLQGLTWEGNGHPLCWQSQEAPKAPSSGAELVLPPCCPLQGFCGVSLF